MGENNRIVALIDMDCFYCQVEEKINPDLRGKPIAVVQYNEWKGGGIIAVNYLARAKGVTRSMRGDEARELCPDIALPKVPCVRGKADISKYRDAGKEVALVLQRFTPLLERASIDEAYLDVTQVVIDRMNSSSQTKRITSANLPNTFVLGYSSVEDFISEVYKDNSCDEELFYDQKHSMQLLVGAVVISEIREAVYEATGYRCSAGIAHNKIMSKLVCGMNKPNKQTLLPLNAVTTVYESLPLNKIKSLGGKFGVMVCDVLKISKMKDLIHFSEKDLQKLFEEKNGSWLYNIARGIDIEPVTPRFTSKSIGCCKKFAGKSAILTLSSLTHWLGELGDEIEERLKTDSLENNRYPTQVVVSFTKQLTNGKDVSCSRSINVKKGNDVCGKMLAEHSLLLIKKDSKPFSPTENQDPETTILTHPIKYLGISVGKFEELSNCKKGKNIVHFFGQNLPTDQQIDENLEESVPTENSDQNQTSPILKRRSLNLTEKQDSTSHTSKLSIQESFFVKYFKGSDKLNDPVTNLDVNNEDVLKKYIVSEKEGSESPKKYKDDPGVCLPHNESILDEECNSDDSECTIDLEINRSKLLSNCEESHSNITTRPSVPRNFFTFSKSDDINEEISDEQNTSVIICNECNKNIPATEFSVHSDYHVALALRQEERRSIQKPIVQSALVQQEQKKKKGALADVNKTGNIASFFGKLTEMPVNDDVPTEKCFECGKNIKLSDFSEHLDYHEAKKLSIEINKPLLFIHSTETGSGKRKRDPKEDASKKNKKDGNKPNISSFFKEK